MKLDAARGSFELRNLTFSESDPLDRQPDFSELVTQSALLPEQWPVCTMPSIKTIAPDRASINGPLVLGDRTGCDAGAIDSLRINLPPPVDVNGFRVSMTL